VQQKYQKIESRELEEVQDFADCFLAQSMVSRFPSVCKCIKNLNVKNLLKLLEDQSLPLGNN